MPHQGVEKYIAHVDCWELLCQFCDDLSCSADTDIQDLIPNDKKQCCWYNLRSDAYTGIKFKDVDDLLEFVKGLQNTSNDIEFHSTDENSTSLFYKEFERPKGSVIFLVQMSEGTEKCFDFKISTEGSLLLIDKNQLKMEI